MNKNYKLNGGDASNFMIAAAGDMNNQHVVPGTHNLLQYNNLSGQTFGGKKQKYGGKSVLADIAVPAVLLYANNNVFKNSKYGKSRFNKSKFRKSKFRKNRFNKTRKYRK
jgi:hypothetical protein